MRYLLAILSLELLLTLHELGHFLVARLFGVRSSQFIIGFGPTLFSFRGAGTTLLIKCIPIGASARVRGMNPHESDFDRTDPTSFASRARWKRALVIGSGPAVNLMFCLITLVALHVAGTHVPVPMTVGNVAPGSEAARAQLRPGDRIETLGGEKVTRWSVLVQAIADNPGKTLTLGIDRRGEPHQVVIRPRPDDNGAGRIGITQQYVFRRQTVREAVSSTLGYIQHLAAEGLSAWIRLLHGKPSTEMLRQVLQTTPRSLDAWVRGLAALSLGLALFFIIPLPGLDGGRLLFLVVEALLGRPLPSGLETVLHALGFLALLAALLAVPIRELLTALGY